MIFEFLVVLIISLLFGNGLLYFTSSSNKESQSLANLKQEVQGQTQEMQPQEINSFSLPEVYVDEIYEMQASLRSVNEKIKLAHQRIAELEGSLNSINSVLVSKPEGSDFNKKIKRLEDFKRNASIELEAIKKLLKQLKEFREIKNKKSLPAKKKELEINKRIHELVFNTSKKD